jgi:hypothetical protein
MVSPKFSMRLMLAELATLVCIGVMLLTVVSSVRSAMQGGVRTIQVRR